MADSFDTSSIGSISVSISKGSVYESSGLSMYDAALDDALKREEKSLSNEAIQRGDTLLDTYSVEADAISGGMGSVWRVHHRSWNTDLAMKRPQPRFFAEGSKKRKENFIKECEAWINLGLHPNIVSCYYVREIGGVPTIFSEWMDNGSLKDRIKDGSLYVGAESEQVERLLDLSIQFACGLCYSHGNNLIHRDVKPDNLLLTRNWDAKVADFGLAKARDDVLCEEGIRHNGGYTPEYCSSEQAAGREADARTDIYSWALSVLEMFTKGRIWEDGPSVSENREAYINAAKLPMPDMLRELLYNCLEADADKRPGDFATIGAELQKVYRAETGNNYPREDSKAAADTADSLNNRALSFIDLQKTEEAERCWEKALKTESNHIASITNQQLWLWRSAAIDDTTATQRLSTLFNNTKSLDAANALLSLYIELGMYDEAGAFANQPGVKDVAEANPEWADVLSQSSTRIISLDTELEWDVESAEFLQDGTLLVADGSDYLYRVDPQTGALLEKLNTVELKIGSIDRLYADKRHGWCCLYKYSHTRDHAFIFTMNGNHPHICFEVLGQSVRFSIDANEPKYAPPDHIRINELWFSDDGAILFALVQHSYFCSYNDTDWDALHIHSWNAETGQIIDTVEANESYNGWGEYEVVSPGGKYRVRCSGSRYSVYLQDSGRCIRSVQVYIKGASSRSFGQGTCCFSADGRLLLVPQAAGPRDITLFVMTDHLPKTQLSLSKIVDIRSAKDYEKQKADIQNRFDACMSQRDVYSALELFVRYREIPGNENAAETIKMEQVIALYCVRTAIHHVQEEAVPTLSLSLKMYSRLDTNTPQYRQVEKYFKGDNRIQAELSLAGGKTAPVWLQKKKYDNYFIRSDEKYTLVHYTFSYEHSNDGIALGQFDMKNNTVRLMGWAYPVVSPHTELTISPNEQHVAYLLGDELYLQRIGHPAQLMSKTGMLIYRETVMFSPDSRFTACAGTENGVPTLLFTSSSPDGAVLKIQTSRRYKNDALAFSDDGFYIVDNSHETCVRVSYNYAVINDTGWDDGANSIIEVFSKNLFALQSEESLALIHAELTRRGYGWLRREDIRARLKEMGSQSKGKFSRFGKKK